MGKVNTMEERIRLAIIYTYEAIHGDLAEAYSYSDRELDLAGAIEGCIDADRVLAHGGDEEAAQVLYSLTWDEMKVHGHEALKGYYGTR